jgi:hypothetical protein
MSLIDLRLTSRTSSRHTYHPETAELIFTSSYVKDFHLFTNRILFKPDVVIDDDDDVGDNSLARIILQ